MSIAHLLTRTATLLTRTYDGALDELGDPTWQVVARDVPCELQQAGSTEAHQDAVMQTSWRVFLLASESTVTGWDALVIDGETYELVGDVSPVWNPRQRVLDHVEAFVTRTRDELPVEPGVAA